MLAVVICAIALSLAYPVREYIAQRQQIDQLLAAAADAQRPGAGAAAEQQRLADLAYIEQQARDQLHMCFPGETVLRGHRPVSRPQSARAGTPAAAASTPWYERVAVGAARRTGARARMITPRTRRSSRAARPATARAAAVAHRCPCGLPDVVETAPRLPDGTPFPTLYYLTCPRAAAAIGRLEAAG